MGLKKSIKSGVLFLSLGQYVDLSVECQLYPNLVIASYSCFPFVVLSPELQLVCLVLRWPATMKLSSNSQRKITLSFLFSLYLAVSLPGK